jgi:hypothetical protein
LYPAARLRSLDICDEISSIVYYKKDMG